MCPHTGEFAEEREAAHPALLLRSDCPINVWAPCAHLPSRSFVAMLYDAFASPLAAAGRALCPPN